MTVTATLSHPPYLGGATATEVPSLYPVALAGRPLLVEDGGSTSLFPSGSWRHETVPLTRQQADQGERPGESTINPEAAWRRTIDSWHKGAGQANFDRIDSNPFRFRDSKGVDPWDDWSISLLPDVIAAGPTSETNVKCLVVNTRLYFIDGATIAYVTDLTPPTGGSITITGSPGDFLDLTSDGTNVYVTDGANIWKFAWDASATGAAWSTVDCDDLEFVNGRLMGSHDDDIFYFDGAGAKTDVVVAGTVPTNFNWVGFAEGPSAIYAAGYVGDHSTIFRIPILDDGSGLDVAIPAGVLPDGEVVASLFSYVGFLLIGTTNSVRFADIDDGSGNLTIGAELVTGSTVRCFEGQNSFVWFGWEDFDEDSTGLGRLDLREFSNADKLAPAYASDLMATGSGAVTSIASFDGVRVFTVAGLGGYVEDPDNLVASGWVRSGEINFGLVEPKVALSVRVMSDTVGSHEIELSAEGGAYASLGVHTDDTAFTANQERARWFELRLTLYPEADNATGPTVGAVMLEVQPSVPAGVFLYAPIILHEKVELARGQRRNVDVEFELENIAALNRTRQVVTYQEGRGRHTVTVEDHEFRIWRMNPATGNREGTVLVKMKEISS